MASADPSKREPSGNVEEDKGAKRVGCYTLAGLSLVWDNCSAIRHRLRGFEAKLKKTTNHAVEKTVNDLKANHDIMTPVCHLIRTTGGLLPNVDKLAGEICLLCNLWQVTFSADLARKQAWALRHFVSVLKNSVWVDKTGLKHVARFST